MNIRIFTDEVRAELHRILDFWARHMTDARQGGYHGEMDGQNRIIPESPRGAVLNARILWSFSAAQAFVPDPLYKLHSDRAYEYFTRHFIDRQNGGVFWSLDHAGTPLERRKQVYAQAFAIYALSEYFASAGKREALDLATGIFSLVEKHARDIASGGYFEAFTEEWGRLEDVRLSGKDLNEPKSMNTHLHLLEAYTNLYRVWPGEVLLAALRDLIHVYLDRIIDTPSGHQSLFFDEQWKVRSTKYSFGHDIEASWLLYEAAAVTGDREILEGAVPVSLRLVEAAMEGLDSDSGLMNEVDHGAGHLDSDKHWWPQAEAMVGFLNAGQITGNIRYRALAMNTWGFIKNRLLDRKHGEWFWRVKRDGTVAGEEVKAGFWKCPYHTTRACIEILRRLHRNNKEQQK